MNDYEVSLYYPIKGRYGSGGRTVMKMGLTREQAQEFGKARANEVDPRADIWITRSPVGQGTKFIQPICMR